MITILLNDPITISVLALVTMVNNLVFLTFGIFTTGLGNRGLHGIIASILVIGLGAPTAVNVVLTSIELDNEPEFASQAVFTSTILSMITINLVIMAAFTLIPA